MKAPESEEQKTTVGSWYFKYLLSMLSMMAASRDMYKVVAAVRGLDKAYLLYNTFLSC